MPKPPSKLTIAARCKIWELAQLGVTQKEIARRLDMSTASVSRSIAQGDPAPEPAEPDDLETSDAPLELSRTPLEMGELRGVLGDIVTRLQHQAESIRLTEPGAYASVVKVLAQVAAQLARLTPPDPPKLEDSPDVRAEAEKGMALMQDYLRD